jgi:protocatechuate 3,4-dioxygenase beta subunit
MMGKSSAFFINLAIVLASPLSKPMVVVTRFILLSLALWSTATSVLAADKCRPTPWDEIGPFYRPNAPIRSKIGSGYVLSGTVRSSADCKPIAGARVEFWQVGRGGVYDDAHRAAIMSDAQGRYRLETDLPPPYVGRPPHIHILVDAAGYAGLITQHYPKRGTSKASFDLVLAPE